MKIACCGDIHLGEFKDFAKNINIIWDFKELEFIESSLGVNVNSRLIDAANCLIEIRKKCVENNIDTLLIAGDLFHNRGSIPVIVYNIAYRILESFKLNGIKVIMIPGNHDQRDNTDYPENSLKPFSWMCTLLEKPDVVHFGSADDSVEVLCIPYSKNKQIVLDAVNNYVPDPKIRTHIIMSHLGVCGGLTGTSSYSMMDVFVPEELRYEDVDFVVLGHYHKAQIIKGTDNKMFYTGSPLQMNFNDEGDKRGFWIIDTDTNLLEFNELNAPKFITVNDSNYKELQNVSKNFIKLKLDKVTEQQCIDSIIKELGSKIVNEIKVETKKEYISEHRSDITFSMSYEDIIRRFCMENNLSNDSLIIGLDILNSIM